MNASAVKNRLPVILLIVILLLLAGLILYTVTAASRVSKVSEAIGTDSTPSKTAVPLRTAVPATPTPAPTALPVLWEDPAVETSVEAPFWSDGTLFVENTYRSPTLSVTLTVTDDAKTFSRRVKYYVADIRVSDVTQIRTANFNGDFSKSGHGSVKKMAKKANALVAISGDYCGFHHNTLVIRNGVVYRDKISSNDVCLLLRNGEMETIRNSKANIKDILAKDPWQAWEFGPALLESDGTPRKSFGNHTINPKNPRSCIGYIEPGHYLFVVADGRQKGSHGLTLVELASLMSKLGCKQAFNLDGGASAHLYWKDKIYNSPSNGGREISDIIYVEKESYPTSRTFFGKAGIKQ